MFLSNLSVKQPLATSLMVTMLVIFGFIALKNLRVNSLPDVDLPLIYIDIPYPGASPETVEREIIDRLEKLLQSIPKVDQIHSTANEGSAAIYVMFKFEKDMVVAADEIRNAIASVRHKLPLEMREPILQRNDPFAQPAMRLVLSSGKLPFAEISRMAEDILADRFRTIDGVSAIMVEGALKRELSVLLRIDRLREYNMSAGEVVNALREQNVTVPVGSLRGPFNQQGIRLIGRIGNVDEFKNIILRQRDNRIIRLEQVAEIDEGFADVSGYNFQNGISNVGISLIRSRDSSAVSIAEEARRLVDRINNELPEGTRLEVTLDGGEEARNSLNNVIETLLFGALLTVFVVYIFLNSWRSTLITALSLPISVMASFIAVWACGFSLNFMTLLALSLSIGVLIDDAIVVRENIVRHMEAGADAMTAAIQGTQEIGLAVIATTFSIIAVFIPVAFMHGGAGAYFRPFALTVAVSVLVSLFVSFTLDPMLSAYWSNPADPKHERKRQITLWLENFNQWFNRHCDRYVDVVRWALNRRRTMAGIACSSFLLAMILQAKLGGSSFLPATDSGNIAIKVRTPSSASLEYNRLKVEKAAELARALPDTRATNSRVYAGGGLIYVDIGKSTQRARSADTIAAEIRKRLTQLVGAEYAVFADLSSGAEKPINIQFFGTDARRLNDISMAYMAELSKIPGAVDVELSELEPKEELKVELDRGLASSLHISVNDAARALRIAFAGIEVGEWVDGEGKARDVAIRLHPDDRVLAANIKALPITVADSAQVVPLGQIARFTMDKGPAQINHSDGKRVITVSANAEGRSSGEVTTDALGIANAIKFPPGYGIELGGASRNQQRVFSEMFTALLMGILLMYFILVIQFNSFTAPLSVMVSLPLSLIGVVIALLLTRCTLNLMSLIGIVMLMGLVAKNAILLLEYARKEEAQGVQRTQALMVAGRARLRPILMTTFALIAGMLPVAIGHGEGGEFYRPMAVAIIGGTITSTMLTLLVVPTFYESIEGARERMMIKFHRRRLRWSAPAAFLVTLSEAFSTLLIIRTFYRVFKASYVWLLSKI